VFLIFFSYSVEMSGQSDFHYQGHATRNCTGLRTILQVFRWMRSSGSSW